jgi:protein-L-isoaspartate(D-aspartate) O-methyltransferase
VSGLAEQRRFLAEELEAVCGLRTPALVDAFASVPREAFLPPGPWLVRSETDYLAGAPRHTPDADARRVCHNIAVAIDPARQLSNGVPSLLGTCIDRLALVTPNRDRVRLPSLAPGASLMMAPSQVMSLRHYGR